ncbi:MAG: hypothetical protein ACD_30C00010G0005 [uncultured bacterium]|uniref:Site-2 protease, Metallo peptidase, MEROPS family M50B n=4 Tax=Candidatus Daviesiibacteriota TaxID=1752718 RepID=A0A0G0EQP7_9BACT|nr:MAG: hypothetical protein ACD_30C00010G0005 [uncultured bacterium]KKQ07847.1 MAG: Site-2 protease, Metallo peptidase, MEROPS family M50B [Candidatus Daviesbacteria bacterium GW2011_GWB1_36_5]KKQ14979.1 MAG: Site-2 protease, Metallo peptidase, MEROPS family M50B [Candidatus Daviesbacteria bacterium GW2011_GWA1_36_8]OGE16823.1 MAG: hypothetical protein A2858_02875 [Candidatus Daviesbacteria bacterium RIFCSPHIGHO2_01_FULL_36_37]OGE31182.1 MAG: hypothetical protein A3C99_00850 [Candidatus Davies
MFILVFIITILILVVIHELGHFFAAKKFNIKVLEFGFGLPPRAWGKKIGETIWSLNWLPFGGFVRLLGEDEVDKEVLDNTRSFAAQPVTKRMLVVVAGVVMNLILAWLLFYIVLGAQNFKAQVPLLSDHKFAGVSQTNEKIILIGDVVPNSPASQAGLSSGERVIAVDSEEVLDANQFIEITKQKAGQPMQLTVSDIAKSDQRILEITPRENPPSGEGPLGVSLGTFEIANLEYKEPLQIALSGPIHSYNLITYSWEILAKTVSYSFAQKDITPVSQNVAGPIGITNIVKEILSVKNPLIPYLDFMAALSLNLAIINILPFPGLDGGRFFFLLLEAITRKKAHPTIEKYVHTIGLAILLGLIFLVTLSDIKKLIPQ